jgi:hypothetical protein
MVTITRPNVFPIAMPTPDEIAGLLAISRPALFPKAQPLGTQDGREFFQSFAVAFGYIATLRRSGELKDRADVWIDRCEHWAHERHGKHVGIGLSAFICAIAASGDTDFRLDLKRWPHDVLVGLAWNEGPSATATGWRQVLTTKRIRASTPAPRSLYPQPHPLLWRA